MPVKNGAHFLLDSLNNLKQSCDSTDEILVINDFSQDETVKILMDVIKKDRRVRFINNSKPGLVNALNLGLTEASNIWVARADVDDRYERSRITEQRNKIDNHVVGIFTDYDFFSDTSSSLGTIPSAVESNSVAVSLISSQRTAHPSILYNKESVLSVGGYREEDFPAEDLSLWLRLSRVGELISVPQVLLHYRLSASSITGTRRLESFSKKKILLKNIGINYKNLEYVLQNLSLIFDSYKKYPNQLEREMLLIRDLYLISKNCLIDAKSKTKIEKYVRIYGIKNLVHIPKIRTIIKLQKEKYARNKQRFEHQGNLL